MAAPSDTGGRRSYLPLSGTHRFASTFRDGTRVRRGGITVVAAPGSDGPPRVGLVAGRRVGGAVARNRAKRRLRAVLDRTELVDGMHYVVIATPAVVSASFEALTAWVQEAVAAVQDVAPE